jgi:TIR domain
MCNRNPVRSRIFVSYARPNQNIVSSLVRLLKSTGLDVWFDKSSLLGGQDWSRVIVQEIRKAKLFLLCLSAEATDRRGYFYTEMRTALDVASTVPPNELYIMPVRLNSCPIPDEIGRYHVLDLFEEGGSELLLRSISAALDEDLSGGQMRGRILTPLWRLSPRYPILRYRRD